jgi:prepilin-type N-terminal cleavage/methylation domain-containing protein
MNVWAAKQKGFTIVELLIVIVVIAILAAIVVVAYSGMQTRAKNTSVQSEIKQVQRLIESYNALNGSYPTTGGLSQVYTDANCSFAADSDGYKGTDWVPSLSAVTAQRLPQSSFGGTGRSGAGGCYAYSSDGTQYILSAWNAKRGGSSTDALYRRLGYREEGLFSANSYICNHPGNIGGVSGGVYTTADNDYYKQSYTVSNITSCNETPPAGA